MQPPFGSIKGVIGVEGSDYRNSKEILDKILHIELLVSFPDNMPVAVKFIQTRERWKDSCVGIYARGLAMIVAPITVDVPMNQKITHQQSSRSQSRGREIIGARCFT